MFHFLVIILHMFIIVYLISFFVCVSYDSPYCLQSIFDLMRVHVSGHDTNDSMFDSFYVLTPLIIQSSFIVV